MSGLRAATSLSSTPSVPTAEVRAMQDVLYDILATGIDPEQTNVPIEAIEQFLFEHARAAKTREQFRAFFAEHGLTVSAPQLAEAVRSVAPLPPISRAADELPKPRLAVAARVADEDDDESVAELPPHLSLVPAAAAPAAALRTGARTGLIATWVTLGCLTIAVGILAAGSYVMVNELRAEVQRTAHQGQQDRAELKALRDHAAGLESSVAATGELVERVDQKSDLLLESLLTKKR